MGWTRPVERPSFESIFMRHAFALAQRSSCRRLGVGCVIVTPDFQRTLSIGYNGNAKGFPNDCDSDEPGKCGCIHAETNAIVKCEPNAEKIVFVTHLPCAACAKLIVQLGGVRRVVYAEDYRIRDGLDVLKRANIYFQRIAGQ